MKEPWPMERNVSGESLVSMEKSYLSGLKQIRTFILKIEGKSP